MTRFGHSLWRAGCAALLAALAAGCSDAPSEPEVVPERDPLTIQALHDPILVDPDLAGMNEANAALTINYDGSIPPIDVSAEEASLAALEATDLLGGSEKLLDLPPPMNETPDILALAPLPGDEECAAAMKPSAIWGARLPESIPIYPRSALIYGAGNTSGTCNIRTVTFVTPVAGEQVARFYFSLARRAGFSSEVRRDGMVFMQAEKQGARLLVSVARRPDGATQASLLLSGIK